jgi:hypothetical protein
VGRRGVTLRHQTDLDMTTEESPEPSVFKILIPYLSLTALSAVALTVALIRWTPLATFAAPPPVVSFDIIKYTNAQRAVASTFLKQDSDITKANELLLKIPERTREAIFDVAGIGTLVVVKQAVVQGQTRDITDDVLKKLGLPTNVPTSDSTAYVIDQAPTSFTTPPPKKVYSGTRASSGDILP